MPENRPRGEVYDAVLARLDQLVALVQGRVAARLDQLAAGLMQVQDRLTQLEERLAQLRADLDEAAIWPHDVEESADSTVEPEPSRPDASGLVAGEAP